MSKRETLSQIIRSNKNRLATSVIESMFRDNPTLNDKYQHLTERLISDVQFHFDYLSEAIEYRSLNTLRDYSRWLIVFFRELDVSVNELVLTFKLMQKELEKLVDYTLKDCIIEYFDIIYKNLYTELSYQVDSFLENDNPYTDLTLQYFTLVQNQKRREAAKLLIDALQNGVDIKDIYIHVFQRSQREIGRLWQINKLSVVEEHFFTAATQLIMSQLYPYLFATKKAKGKIIAACVGRELHELGIRMVADFLEIDGWNTIFIGANTPFKSLFETVNKEKPDLIALSTTIMPHLKSIREIIEAIRNDIVLRSTKIIVGGYPFNNDINLWKAVNADGFAPDAQQAIPLVNNLLS